MSITKGNTGRILYQKDVVDFQTGEIAQTEREIRIPKEPDFVKLYLDDLVMLKDIPQWVSGILYGLLKRMNYQNEIVLNATIKKRIADDLGIAARTIDNALVTFAKKNILTRVGLGVYQANPYLFGKGEWNNIRKIRLQVEYGESGSREVIAELSKSEDEVHQPSLEEILEELHATA
jgi:hypothetical protein